MLSALCSPLSKAVFIHQYLGKSSWRSDRNQPHYFDAFFKLSLLNELLSYGRLLPGEVVVYNAGQPINIDKFLKNTQGLYANNIYDNAKLQATLQQGNTLVLNGLHKRIGALATLCERLSQQLNATVQANAYITPPNAHKGLALHYDNHDVFVLQLAGNKTWRVLEQCIESPLNQPIATALFENASNSNAASFSLKQGESLYIPAGYPHDAVSNDEYTVHLTLGIIHTRNNTVFKALAKKAEQHLFFRQPLFNTGDNNLKTKAATLKQELQQLLDTTDFEQLLQQAHTEHTAAKVLTPQLDTLLQANTINENSCIKALATPQLVLEGVFCTVAGTGQQLTFPVLAAPFLRVVITTTGTPIAISSLASPLGDSLKVNICKKLFLAGFLQLS